MLFQYIQIGYLHTLTSISHGQDLRDYSSTIYIVVGVHGMECSTVSVVPTPRGISFICVEAHGMEFSIA